MSQNKIIYDMQTEKPRGTRHVLRNMLIVICFLALIVGSYWHHVSLNRQIDQIRQNTERIESQIQEERRIQIDLEGRQGYMLSDEYYARLARSRFHLIREGEKIFVFR
ncbi:MAG: septum formation initiator family protein [Firmicutes bacterium]|nr:septum formation initiator family protein [Bacillota bacterium]